MAGDWLASLELLFGTTLGHPGLHSGMTGRRRPTSAGYDAGRPGL